MTRATSPTPTARPPGPGVIGILGVGEIAGAIVTGLCAEVAVAPRVLLSPRGSQRAAGLAGRFPTVTVAAGNQAVLDGCSVLLIALPPRAAAAVLESLVFTPDTRVVSVMVGISDAALRGLVAPATDVARAVPLPAVARRAGVTVIAPDAAAARAVFEPLGDVIAVTDPHAFDAMAVATGTIAAHLEYLAAIGDWLTRQGVRPAQASRYVGSVFAGLAGPLGGEEAPDLGALARAHATPGGINERVAAALRDAGTFERIAEELQAILDDQRR